jgi:hypothetical protein
MNRRKINLIIPLSLLIIINGCLEPYAPPASTIDKNYLVVDGFINASDNSSTITLTRSQPLNSSDSAEQVTDAAVSIEDSDGNSRPLTSKGAGVYVNTNLAIDASKTYRLHISEKSEDYYSDFVPVNQSPSIDSVQWSLQQVQGDTSVRFYVNTHGSENQSRYYLWSFQETWLYSAAYNTEVKFSNGVVYPAFDSVYFCWKTVNSTSILIASSTQLSQNVISHFQLHSEPVGSIKLRVGYSFLVNQLSITKDAFEYWQKLKSNTENLGTIFGTLPSQFSGNIRSATNPSEPVFGYFFAGSLSSKRIFITPYQLPKPTTPAITGYEDCQLFALPIDKVPTYTGGGVFVRSYGFLPEGYYLSTKECTDCRYHGGTNVKPGYWY